MWRMRAPPTDSDRTTTRVADVMHAGLVGCPPDTALDAVAAVMSRERIHCVVVMSGDTGTAVWGIVSDVDLIAAASVRPLAEQEAGGTAMKPAITIDPDASLDLAARVMTQAGVAHLVVVDPIERRPIGVLSTLDLAAAFAKP
jgi:CBS domain-containing protein